jgi:pimeloyl-ACP methyl ester carboxylesterase
VRLTARVTAIAARIACTLILSTVSGACGSGTTRVGSSARTRLALQPCVVPDTEGDVRCGAYPVFENRATMTGRRIDLHIVVVKASSAQPAADPVFWLSGGPGDAATESASATRGSFLQDIRTDHDLVFVDQRGTGQSHPLNCDLGDDPSNLSSYFGELFPLDLVRRCKAQLQSQADLTLYTTPIAMDDLDEVRAALGYDRIDLAAASYGTIAAQVYLRQHPGRVRAMFLLGVATPAVKQPLLFARGAQHALELLFEDCAADATCRSVYPDFRREFEAVLSRFASGPQTVQMTEPATGRTKAVVVSRDNFVERIRFLLYATTTARLVPFIVHRVYQQDYGPFEEMAIRQNPGGSVARGVYLTVTCSEGVPFISEREVISEARGTFVGEQRVRAHMRACQEWPRAQIPVGYIEPVTSNVPVLIVSGEADGSTPPWFGADAVKHLPNGRQVTIRYYGHQLDSPCVWSMLSTFIRKGSADAVDTTCTTTIRRPPFATELPARAP